MWSLLDKLPSIRSSPVEPNSKTRLNILGLKLKLLQIEDWGSKLGMSARWFSHSNRTFWIEWDRVTKQEIKWPEEGEEMYRALCIHLCVVVVISLFNAIFASVVHGFSLLSFSRYPHPQAQLRTSSSNQQTPKPIKAHISSPRFQTCQSGVPRLSTNVFWLTPSLGGRPDAWYIHIHFPFRK